MRVAALLEHPGHEGPDAVEQAEEVHAEHPLPVGGGALPGDPGLEHAGVVAEQVHRAEAVVRRVGEGPHLGLAAYVGADPERLGAEARRLGDRLVEGGRLDVGEHDVHPLAGGVAGEPTADPARGAGDDGDAPDEVVHQRSPRKQVRTSSTKNAGCSMAAKCPPRGASA